MNQKILFAIVVTLIVTFAAMGVLFLGGATENNTGLVATVYKSPLCGCCVGYSGALDEHGFDVGIVSTEDIESIKKLHNIPEEMESCHTTVIGNYFIEGHMPLEVVDKLLTEQPDIDGIALPDMPAGTPGMPGVKSGSYTIYQLVDGEYSEYVNI